LAVQNQLVTSKSLLEAFQSWRSGDSQSLGDVLLVEQRLSSAELALLDTLVDELIKRHDGSTQKCLDAFCASKSFREELERLQPRHDRDVDDATPPPQPASGAQSNQQGSSSAGIRFHVLHQHAEGGLGVVSV